MREAAARRPISSSLLSSLETGWLRVEKRELVELSHATLAAFSRGWQAVLGRNSSFSQLCIVWRDLSNTE